MALGSMNISQQFESLIAGVGELSLVDHGDENAREKKEEENIRDRSKNEQRGRRPRRKSSDDKAPTNVVDEMLQIIKEKDAELEQLKEKNKKATQQILDLQKRDCTINEQPGRRHWRKMSDDKCSSTNVIDEMLQIIKERDTELEQLKEKYEKAAQQNKMAAQQVKDIQRRSDAITSEMAKVMKEKGNFECVNDEFSNSNITEEFYKLYDNEWVHLSRRLGKLDDSLTELELIHKLTEMLKFVYEECCKAADCQIRQFFLLTDNDPTPTRNQYPELFESRRQFARSDEVRKRLIHMVLEKLKKSEEMGYFMIGTSKEEVIVALETFFEKCIDYCWLMIVSNPPVKLEFNVIGKHHIDCTDHFRIYSLKQPVIDDAVEDRTICKVVWPSICLQDGEACYKKGEVVISQTSKKASAAVDTTKYKDDAMFHENADETMMTQTLHEKEVGKCNHQDDDQIAG